MTRHFEKVRTSLNSEHNRLTEELQLHVSQSAGGAHEGNSFYKTQETASESIELTSQLAVVRHIREQLAEIEHALEKLEKGTYGICDACGKSISRERLEAIPCANCCLDCKGRKTTAL